MVILMELVFSVAVSAVHCWSDLHLVLITLQICYQCYFSVILLNYIIHGLFSIVNCTKRWKSDPTEHYWEIHLLQFQLGCWVGELMDLYFDQPSVEMIITVRLVSQLSFTGDKSGQSNLYLIWVWAHWAMSTIELRSCNNKRRRDTPPPPVKYHHLSNLSEIDCTHTQGLQYVKQLVITKAVTIFLLLYVFVCPAHG